MYLFTPYDILFLPFDHMQQSHNTYQISCSHLLSCTCVALASCCSAASVSRKCMRVWPTIVLCAGAVQALPNSQLQHLPRSVAAAVPA
jgi:hypothetical protein